jgi:hypothetical protein
MTLNPKKSPFLFSLLFGWGVLLFVACLPVWTGWPSNFRKNPSTTLWKAGGHFVTWVDGGDFTSANAHYPLWLREWFWSHIRLGIVVLFGGTVAGRLVYWLIWERPSKWAKNEKEAPTHLKAQHAPETSPEEMARVFDLDLLRSEGLVELAEALELETVQNVEPIEDQRPPRPDEEGEPRRSDPERHPFSPSGSGGS